ncbi:MAG TPA: GlsB/YeaQ/YmgE family stress response membrane protein [Verrucomicrobiae bacterium]|nr:GlsB/YeaQ/YmgE family stress response membrane protein [Verrucomicrobiae bacterium]
MGNLLWWCIVGLIAGFLAGKVMKGGGFGVLMDIVIGIIGAMLGGWLFGMVGISAGSGLIGSIVVAFVGACILLWIVRLIKKA